MLKRYDFCKQTYWTAECPHCTCSIDLYIDPKRCMAVKCENCGQVHNFKSLVEELNEKRYS